MPDGSNYFGSLSQSDLIFGQKTGMEMEPKKGWIYDAQYKKGVTFVFQEKGSLNTTSSPVKNVFADDNSVILEVFVAYKNGDVLRGRTKTFDIIKDPEIKIGYWLRTKNRNMNLEAAISQAIESKMPDFIKLLSP